jgi:hypothetical protein
MLNEEISNSIEHSPYSENICRLAGKEISFVIWKRNVLYHHDKNHNSSKFGYITEIFQINLSLTKRYSPWIFHMMLLFQYRINEVASLERNRSVFNYRVTIHEDEMNTRNGWENLECGLRCCDAIETCRRIPTLRRNMLPLWSGLKYDNSTVLRNIGVRVQIYTVLQPRRTQVISYHHEKLEILHDKKLCLVYKYVRPLSISIEK